VADHVWRYSGDIWRARQMYRYALEHLPRQAKPRYELGFMAYLLGDFLGALDWFNKAAAIVADDDIGLGAQIFYNRALIRYYLEGDKKAAIADLREALKRRPDYEQAKQALRGLKETLKWVPW
jgi:tetratricopeptide (TPR) repeat protein